MKEEKKMILSMLEEGKITSEEALKLIEAIDEKKDFSSKINDKDEIKNIIDSLEDFGSDIGDALLDAFDELKDFGSSLDFKYNYDTLTRDLKVDLSSIKYPILDLRAVNGDIKLKTTDKNMLSIRVVCKYKKGLLLDNNSCFDFNSTDGQIILKPKYNDNISISLDISIPDKSYRQIKLNTSKGSIVSDIFGLNKNTMFDLETSVGYINLNIKGLVYEKNNQSSLGFKKIIAHTIDYDVNREHLEFTASTSNGSIEIN